MVYLWIAFYGIVYTLAGSMAPQASPWFLPFAMMCYLGAFLFWIFRIGLAQRLGLCAPRNLRRTPWLPLLILPIYNILTGKDDCCLPEMLLMVSTCAAEELFFRGFLLRFLQKYGALTAVLLSSTAFSLLHTANLATGVQPFFVLTQIMCAFAVGICYSAIAIQTGSLLWGYAAHLLANATASSVPAEPTVLLWLCIAAYGFYGIILCKMMIEKEENKHEAIH